MRNRIIRRVAVLVMGLAIAGCAGKSYRVSVNTICAPGIETIPQGSHVHVWVDDVDRNDLLKLEIASKIECILVDSGYVVSDFVGADYVVAFGYGIGSREEAYTKTVKEPTDEVGQGFVENFLISYGSHKQVESVRTVNDRWLWAEAYDVGEWLDNEEFTVVWSSETTSTGSSADLRHVLNYLLIPTFERFGVSTGQAEEVTLGGGDERAQRILSGCQ